MDSDVNGDPGVVQHGGPRLDFGERARIYKACSRIYPWGQVPMYFINQEGFGGQFFILDVIPQVIYMHVYPSAGWGGLGRFSG